MTRKLDPRNDPKLAKYYTLRENIHTGDALQWRSSSALGFLIRKFSKAKVNHTSLVVSPLLHDRRYQLEALAHGIAFTAISTSLQAHKGQVWWLPLQEQFEPLAPLIDEAAFDQIGKKYDYLSLLTQMLSRVSTDSRRFFCSEFAYFCWKAAKIPMKNPSGKAPRPGDIPKLGIFDAGVPLLPQRN